MAKKIDSENQDAQNEQSIDPLIKTVSEHAALTEADKQAFRLAGGTVTHDPAQPTE